MDENQIRDILTNDPLTSKYIKGVISYDQLPPTVSNFPAVFIINSDVTGGRGKHWLCIYLEQDRPPQFFDSLGRAPSHYNQVIINFLIRHGPSYEYNSIRLQGPNSDVCADYCIIFTYLRCRGMSFEEFIYQFNGGHFNVNDARIELGL